MFGRARASEVVRPVGRGPHALDVKSETVRTQVPPLGFLAIASFLGFDFNDVQRPWECPHEPQAGTLPDRAWVIILECC